MTAWIGANDILVPEQLGFRKRDHAGLYGACSICPYMLARKLTNKDTYLCFIDLKKAFYSTNRNLLWSPVK